MNTVLDTNILVKGFIDCEPDCLATLYTYYNNDGLKIVIDCADSNGDQVVLSEYRKNLSEDIAFKKWFVAITCNCQIEYFSGKLERRIKDKLDDLGFHEETDQKFVALALEADKYIVTQDSDYGKGNNPKAQESEKQAVLKYLTEELNLKVRDAKEALVDFRGIERQ